MCRAKPFCILQYSDLGAQDIARYVRRCVFYGVWPGNQSSSTTTGKWYWTNPTRVERDRPTYKQYVPLLQQITAAGWQPITLATSSNPDVWIERFGEGDTLYLTVFNPTDKRQQARITLDGRAGMKPESRLRELVTGEELKWEEDGEGLGFAVELDPEDVWVVRAGS